MSLPSRDEIDPEYQFDLTRIYESPDDWDAGRRALLERLDELRERAGAPPNDAGALKALLDALEECFRRKQRLELYAKLFRNVNTDDAEADDRLRRHRELESTFMPVAAAVRRRITSVDDKQFDAWLDEITGYRRYAEGLREEAAFARSDEVEAVLGALEDARTAPTRMIRAITTEDFDPPAVEGPDGDPVAIRFGNYRTELSSADRTYRRRVYEAYHGELDRFEHTLAGAYAEKLKAATAEAAVRGYDSVRHRAFRGTTYPDSGLVFRFPVAAHDAMLDGVRDALDPYRRALEVRRERLGLEALRPWDLHVSIADADSPEVTYEAAREHVLAALAPLGESYVDRVRRMLRERRVDVFPTERKRTDIPAYCPSSATDGAYVLANFRCDVRSTFFLAHELGHAVNVEYHREGPTRYATCPRPVSEVPSILHELLLADHFLSAGAPLAAAARNRLLECLGGNLYGFAMSSAFAHRAVTAVEDGEELTAGRARELWAALQAEFLAPVAFDDRASRNWLGRGLREIYSGYQYVLGATGALAARDRLQEDVLSPAGYREFLRNTGSEPPLELFEHLGCDVTTTEPYEHAAGAYDGYVDAVAESE